MGEYGRSDRDQEAGLEGAPVSTTAYPEKKMGAWGQCFPAISREEGLKPVINTDGQFSEAFEPIQEISKTSQVGAQYVYKNTLAYDHPAGIPGVLMQCVNPDQYQYVFFPQASPLFVDKEGKASTRVFSLDDKKFPEYDKASGIHALLRVKQLPGGTYVPALNLGGSPDAGGFGAFTCKLSAAVPVKDEPRDISSGETEESKSSEEKYQQQSGYKLVEEWVPAATFKGQVMATKKVSKWVKIEEEPSKTEEKKKEIAEKAGFIDPDTKESIGLLSWQRGGPLMTGCEEDQHTLGKNSTGEVTNSGHISHKALYFRDKEADGPFDFCNVAYPPETAPVTQGTPIPVYLSWDNRDAHDWAGVFREGKWKWWTVIPGKEEPENTRTKLEITQTKIVQEKTIKKTYTERVEQLITPFDEGNFEEAEKYFFQSAQTVLGLSGGKDVIAIEATPKTDTGALTPGKSMSLPQKIQPEMNRSEQGMPAVVFSAIRRASDQAYDYRFGEEEKNRRRIKKIAGGAAPFVGRIQGFGQVDSASKKWKYTKQEEKFYKSGTANGGLWVTPPEILRDGDENTIGTASTSAFALHPDMTFAFGKPTASGTVQDGPYLECSGAAGSRDLDMKFKDNSDAARDGIVKIDGLVHVKERSGAPTCSDGYAALYIDTADGHAKIAWQDGVTTKSLDLGAVT